ncbi:MAG: DNA polymerase III subunit gamma/tau [Candidatus Cryptobacteroides sp.]
MTTQYIVSARKYRPDTFESLVGQDTIARTLKNSIVRGQLAHAYLFCGPRGVGKTTTARIFAKAINCSNPSADMEPCGECESCKSFSEGRSYCIHELDAASNNGVEDIKALMDQVRIPPQVGKYSVYIIDEVHMLSQQAFNAFLKTLEEPPAYAIFILATTEKHKILPTILSRCQTYDFNRISVEDIVRQLRDIAGKENITIDDESLHVIASKADGAMRDALTIFDQTVAFCGTTVDYKDVLKNLNVLDYEYSFNLTDAFLAGDYSRAFLIFDEVLSKGFNALHFIAALSSHFRDLLVARSAGLDALLELPASLKERYREQAARCSVKFLYDALGITSVCESGYKASVNPRLHIEFALMRLSMLSAAPAQTAAAPQAAASQTAASQTAAAPQAAASQTAASRPDTTPAAPSAGASSVVPGQGPSSAVFGQGSSTTVLGQGSSTVMPGSGPGISSQPSAATTAQPSAPSQPAAPAPQAPSPETGRIRRARTAKADVLSVKSLTEDKEKVEVEAPAQITAKQLSEQEVKEKWQELSSLYSSKPRLANTIASAGLALAEEDGVTVVTFSVFNQAQMTWIQEKCLHELEGNFQRLTSSTVRLRVDVIPEEEKPQVAYMPSEKAKDLMEKNSEVKSLVTDFGLDVK